MRGRFLARCFKFQKFCFAFGLMFMFETLQPATLLAAGGKEKYAVVDVGKVFDDYEKTKKFDQEFQTEGRMKQEERDAIVHEIRRLRDAQALLSEDARRDKQGAIDSKVKELDLFDEGTDKALKEKRNKAVQEVFQDIEGTIKQFGERKGYDFVFNDRALLYRDKRFDVTAEVLKELNERYKKGQ